MLFFVLERLRAGKLDSTNRVGEHGTPHTTSAWCPEKQVAHQTLSCTVIHLCQPEPFEPGWQVAGGRWPVRHLICNLVRRMSILGQKEGALKRSFASNSESAVAPISHRVPPLNLEGHLQTRNVCAGASKKLARVLGTTAYVKAPLVASTRSSGHSTS